MARIKSGILGPVQGKIGTVVGAIWKGIPYIRKLAEYDKSRKRSSAQLENEAKFKFVNDWLLPFYPFIGIGFQNLAIGKSAASVALSKIYNTVFNGIAPNLSIAYEQMIISEGPLAMVLDPMVSRTAPNVLELSWKQNAVAGTAFNDQLMLVFYAPELGKADGFVGAVNRANQKFTFHTNPIFEGKRLEVYLAMTSMNRKKISDSKYLGTLLPF